MKPRAIFAGLLLFLALSAPALEKAALEVDGVRREFLVQAPPSPSGPLPIVFCYHGHRGHAELFASSLVLEKYWPNAIFVYPQGLNTKSALTDPEGKSPGWQRASGEENDRDIRFFDVSIEYLAQRYPIDGKKVFALGFSNGGAFAYTLLAARKERIAAIAVIASVQNDENDRKRMIGKPVFQAAGRNDKLVKFSWQQAMIDFLVKENRCGLIGGDGNAPLKTYRSTNGVEIRFFAYEGGHAVPPASLPLIVDFFKGIY